MTDLIFLENDMYVRNFITSGVFEPLLNHGSFAVVTSEAVARLRDRIPPETIIGGYERSTRNRAEIARFNKVSMRALRRESSTFDIKVRGGWHICRHYNLKAKVASNRLIFRLFARRYLTQRFSDNPTVERIVAEHKPELVLFPVTGVESTGLELVRLSRKYGFKTFFLVNGWDNLSSKGVFPLLPDYMGVWGPQSVGEAVDIQGMPRDGVVMLGSARYEDYFVPSNGRSRPFPHKYILFAGATTPNDEITPLRMFDDALDEMGIDDIKVVYRPHPWREERLCFDLFEPERFRHVVLDPQVADDYYGEKRKRTEASSSQNFPELSYYPSLLNHALFAISPMSSMTLEAALFDVPALILAHDDGYHPIPGSLQAQYAHFQGSENVPGWTFVRSLSEVKRVFAGLVERFRRETPGDRQFRPALSSAMGQYLIQDGKSYAERLYAAVQDIRGAGAPGDA